MLVTTPPLLDVTVRDRGDGWEMLVSGELDTASSGDLASAAAMVTAARPGRVDIDLSGVTFADTAGWRSVHDTRQQIFDAGGIPRIVSLSPAVEYLVRQWIVVGRAGRPELNPR